MAFILNVDYIPEKQGLERESDILDILKELQHSIFNVTGDKFSLLEIKKIAEVGNFRIDSLQKNLPGQFININLSIVQKLLNQHKKLSGQECDSCSYQKIEIPYPGDAYKYCSRRHESEEDVDIRTGMSPEITKYHGEGCGFHKRIFAPLEELLKEI